MPLLYRSLQVIRKTNTHRADRVNRAACTHQIQNQWVNMENFI